MGSPFIASAPPHSQPRTLPHLPSKDHHFLCFQRPFLTAPIHCSLGWKGSPSTIGRNGGRAQFDPVQLLALQHVGQKSSVSLGLTFLICTMGVLWYVEGVIQFEFPHFSLDT